MDAAGAADHAENFQEPDDHADHDHGVDDLSDFSIHGDVVVHQPKKNPGDYQGNDDVNEH